jgi:hypothetical protein
MSKKANLFAIFRSEPMQWGLRGDPFLWRDMKRTLKAISFPATEADLIALLEKTFRELTGHELPNKKTIEEEDSIFVEAYSHGGMSSGHVSIEFWRNVAIPMLCSRYRESLTR